MPADPLDLDRLERLCAEATPGPWTAERNLERMTETVAEGGYWVERDLGDGFEWWSVPEVDCESGADAEFIAAARTALPALVARCRELEAEGWQPAPLPEPVHEGMILVEFGFVNEGPSDRDRYAYMGSWLAGGRPETRGRWCEDNGSGAPFDDYVIHRWLWLRRGVSLDAPRLEAPSPPVGTKGEGET